MRARKRAREARNKCGMGRERSDIAHKKERRHPRKERTKRRKGAGEKKKNKAAVDIESSERIATDLTGPSASNIGPPILWGINISRPRRFYDPRIPT